MFDKAVPTEVFAKRGLAVKAKSFNHDPLANQQITMKIRSSDKRCCCCCVPETLMRVRNDEFGGDGFRVPIRAFQGKEEKEAKKNCLRATLSAKTRRKKKDDRQYSETRY
ncbi:hypothetical protein CDAR_204731 [Caerostris darwini]|uniref:Uncharacterized protein n=1 Tax=Caerostris darwini TaxID=1538125 RepID=A0AAV4MA39_9ARAC|nr:hypothetical protein CDAR_204731 [Caerostris darwini]